MFYDYETIKYERTGRIGQITLNRPEKLNAVNNQMLRELDDVMRTSDTDVDVKALVIRGAGRAFCSGADLSGDSSELLFHEQAKMPIKDQIDTVTRWNYRWEAWFNY